MSGYFGYLLAAIALISWGLVVIPLKTVKTSGLYGIGISMPVAFAILLGPTLFVILGADGLVFSARAIVFSVLTGIFQFVLGTVFYYESIRLAGISVSAPLTRLKPVLVGLIVFAIGIELLSPKLMIATVLVAIGVGILIYKSGSSDDVVDKKQRKRGIIFALLTCLCWAFGDVFVKEALVGGFSSIVVSEIALLAAILGYYAVIFLRKKQGRIFQMPSGDKIRYGIHGLVSLSIAYLAFFASIGMIGLVKAVIITACWPLVAILIGFIMFKEKFTKLTLIGIIVLIVAAYIVI